MLGTVFSKRRRSIWKQITEPLIGFYNPDVRIKKDQFTQTERTHAFVIVSIQKTKK